MDRTKEGKYMKQLDTQCNRVMRCKRKSKKRVEKGELDKRKKDKMRLGIVLLKIVASRK